LGIGGVGGVNRHHEPIVVWEERKGKEVKL
jgi:hypothetical protein